VIWWLKEYWWLILIGALVLAGGIIQVIDCSDRDGQLLCPSTGACVCIEKPPLVKP
jgi:hypothetical protein